MSRLLPVRNTASCQVVGRQLNNDFVPGENTNEVHSQLPGNMRENLMAVLQLNSKHRIRERFDHRTFDFNNIFLGQMSFSFLLRCVLSLNKAADRKAQLAVRYTTGFQQTVNHLGGDIILQL